MKFFLHFSGAETLARFCFHEAAPGGGNDAGPLKVEDIEDLNDVQRSEQELAEAHAAVTRANDALSGESRDLTLKALKELDADGRFTMEDIKALDGFTPRIKARLAELKAAREPEGGDLGLGLPAAETTNETDPLGLGLPVAGAPENDLGLGLPKADESEPLLGSSGTDELELGVPSVADADPDGVETNTVAFAPDETRCRECAARLVEDFDRKPDELKSKLTAHLVSLEDKIGCSIDEVEDVAREECASVIAKFEKATTDDAAEAANTGLAEEKTDLATDEKSALSADQKEIIEYLDQLGDQLTLSQINQALGKAVKLEDYGTQQNVIGKLQAVKADLTKVTGIATPENPQEAAILRQIVTTTPVSWKAESPEVRYSAILTAIDAGNLSDDTRRRAKEALGIRLNETPSVTTGSDVESALREGRGTERRQVGTRRVQDPETGEWRDEPIYEDVPLAYDKDHPLEVRPGVDAYMKGDKEMMKVTAGANVPPEIDVTGWTGEQKGQLAEVMAFFAATESVGLTGFVQNIYGLAISESTAFNPGQVNEMRQVISLIYGNAEGHDGDIAHFDQKMGIIRDQARMLAETDTATGLENDQAGTRSVVTRLGLKTESGDINHAVLGAFGEFTQSNYGTGSASLEDLHRYLFSRFPDQVERPQGDGIDLAA